MEGVSAGNRSSDLVEPELDALFRDRFEPLVRLGTLLTGSQHVAEELAMDAFARLAPRLSQVDQPAAYLRTSVVNGARSHHRRLRTVRRQPRPRAEGVWDPEVDELWQRLAGLRPDERACVVLRFYEDLPLASTRTCRWHRSPSSSGCRSARSSPTCTERSRRCATCCPRRNDERHRPDR